MKRNAPILWCKLNAVLPMPQTWGANDHELAYQSDGWIKIQYSVHNGFSQRLLRAEICLTPACPDFAIYRHTPVLVMVGEPCGASELEVLRVSKSRRWLKHFNRVAREVGVS